jgi:D-alanyl-D-alanine carboxypeptidase
VRLDDPRDLVRLRFKHPPRSGLLFDLDTGQVLWRRDPTRVLPIASLTKMMTAVLIARHVPPNAKVRITKAALSYQGSGVGLFRRGRRMPGQDDALRAAAARPATTRRSRSPSAPATARSSASWG